MKEERITQKEKETLHTIRGEWYVAEHFPHSVSTEAQAENIYNATLVLVQSDYESDVKSYLNSERDRLKIPEIREVNDIYNYENMNPNNLDNKLCLSASRFSCQSNYWIAPSIAETLSSASSDGSKEIDAFLWEFKYRNTKDLGTNPIYLSSIIARDEADLTAFFNEPNRCMWLDIITSRKIQYRALKAGLVVAPKIIFTASTIKNYQEDKEKISEERLRKRVDEFTFRKIW